MRAAILKALELREETEEPPPRRPDPRPEPHRARDAAAADAPMPVLLPREIAVLNEAGVQPADWPRLPAVVLDRVRLVARAVANGRILMWVAWGSVVLDVGAIQQASQRDPSGAAFAFGQLVAGVLCLVPTPLRTVTAAPAEFGAFDGPNGGASGSGKAVQRRKTLRAGVIMVVAGVVTLLGCAIAAN